MAYPADPIVLDFDAAENTHVWHGYFWPAGLSLGNFLWETWCAPNSAAEYWISEGYGGGHAILAGFGAGVPTGNIWNGSGATSFGGIYTWADGEKGHYAVAWDGTWLWMWNNGVVVGRTAFAGPRIGTQGTLFIGGSDHSNFDGKIYMVRAIEDRFPFQDSVVPTAGFRPERPFGGFYKVGSVAYPASFLASYMGGDWLIPDLGAGYDGIRHPGSLYGGGVKNLGMPDGQVEAGGYPLPAYVVDTASPFGAGGPGATGEASRTPGAVPGSARIYDGHERANQTKAFQDAPTLGSTEGGSRGALAWSTGRLGGAAQDWGILGGKAVCLDYFYGFAYVDNGAADMDARVDRNTTQGIFQTGLCFRLQDTSNSWIAYTYGSSSTTLTVRLATHTAGALESTVANWACPATNWTTLRIVTSGTTITGYVDNGAGGWTQIGQVTGQTAFQTATKCGYYSGYGVGGLGRWDNLTVL